VVEKEMRSKTKSNIFQLLELFPCCSSLWVSEYLISNQKDLSYTTHIKKVIAKLYSFTLRSKITDKQ